MARLLLKLLTVQTSPEEPEIESQPDQFANVEPLEAVAVMLIVLPLGNGALQLDAQLSPGGELLVVPDPVPLKLTLRIGKLPPPDPVPLGQTTFAVIDPVMIAPDEGRFPALLLV